MKTKIGNKNAGKVLCALALSAVVCVGLVGCSSSESSESNEAHDALTDLYDTSGGVASTVNGVDIGENVITAYVELYRTNQGLESESDWAEWMINAGYESTEELRESIIDYYDYLELVTQAADKEGVTVSDAEVDEAYQEVRDQYGSEEEWEEALAYYGTSDSLQLYTTRLSLLQEGTMEKLAENGELGDVEATDDEVLEYVQYYSDYGPTKRSSHILFAADDEETAQEVLDKIKSGDLSFEDAVKEYSTDKDTTENNGDVGYDDLNTFADEYIDALDGLNEGEISDLVTDDDGIHIIKCTEVIDPGEEEVTSLDKFSDDYVDHWREYLTSYNEEDAFTEWMDNFQDEADIVINPMPENLPYYVDLTAYEESEETDSSSADSSATEEADSTSSSSADESSSSSASDSSSSGSSSESESTDASSSSATSSASDSDSSSSSSASDSGSASSSATEESSSSSSSEASAN